MIGGSIHGIEVTVYSVAKFSNCSKNILQMVI